VALERDYNAPVSREQLFALLRAYHGAPRSYFATMPRLSYLRHQECIVPYRRGRQVAILLDAPIGPSEQHADALTAFVRQMLRDGLQPACYKLLPELAPAAVSAGLSGVKFGEEAIIDLRGLTLKGGKARAMREALTLVPQEGYSAHWYDLSADPHDWKPRLREISRGWLSRKFGSEIGFAISRMAQAERFAREQRCMLLLDPRGQPQAFITLVPMFVPGGGWALDLMRREEQLPRDAMRFLISRALFDLRDAGHAQASLGLAPLADVTADEWPGEKLTKARELIFQRFNQLYNFRGLYRFKSHFMPHWEPRYLAFTPNSLPLVLISLYRAHWT
jgi:phosphatidylglycerol lysyltransferase